MGKVVNGIEDPPRPLPRNHRSRFTLETSQRTVQPMNWTLSKRRPVMEVL